MHKNNNAEPTIIVRDRREKHQFSIHNRVIDEWLPIIDKHGYAMYSLYVRLANKADERSWPGYTLIERHLGIGPATISNFNRLLTWCGLIHVEPGDRKTSNEYYILNVPTCTPEAIQDIRNKATTHFPAKSTFLQALLRRLETWQPIQERWARGRKKPVIIHPNQLPLPEATGQPASPGKVPTSPGEDPTSPGKVPTSPGEDPTSPGKEEQSETTIRKQQSEITIQTQQSTTTSTTPTSEQTSDDVVGLRDILSDFNVQEPVLSQLVTNNITTEDVQAWIWYTQTQSSLTDPTAFVISRLQQHIPPPAKLRELVGITQQLNDEDWEILQEYVSDRKLDGNWWRLLSEEQGDKRLAGLFTEELLETWYTFCCVDQPVAKRSNSRRDSKTERNRYAAIR